MIIFNKMNATFISIHASLILKIALNSCVHWIVLCIAKRVTIKAILSRSLFIAITIVIIAINHIKLAFISLKIIIFR